VLLALGGGLLAGCGKKTPAVVTAAPPAAAAASEDHPVLNPLPPTGPPAVPVDTQGSVDLRELNHTYISWIVQNHVRPKTFESFVSLSGMAAPPAPAGKKFIIDRNGFIALVDH
jgi:hypothetical protein